jgi:hypothetical protein
MMRLVFVTFSHLHPDLLDDEEELYGSFRMTIEQFHHLSQWMREEIPKQNTNYRTAIPPEERL